ncbi:unnamed protein product [Mycena citricolor]|uniref:NADH dehydrogenase 1 alpha subcomplex n=1 Tax=Mycena citricolor TaxID=2018698 RepID=A0AAD2JUI7_9AGAR|nr:unnamed protein product [Mycena citricolor]CAK5276076.1 unnamed protein product [Mycena citricolor]
MPTTLRSNIKPWLAVEALPIVMLVGGIVSFASFFAYRSAMGPSIQWTKNEPWNSIKPDEGVKMVQVNHKFEKRRVEETWHETSQLTFLSWKRDQL